MHLIILQEAEHAREEEEEERDNRILSRNPIISYGK